MFNIKKELTAYYVTVVPINLVEAKVNWIVGG